MQTDLIKLPQTAENDTPLSNIAIILHQPRYSENIGSSARAMLNMGIDKLIVVDPPNLEMEKAQKLATHAAKQILDRMTICSDLEEAVAEFNYVVGTTARRGGQRNIEFFNSTAAEKIVAVSRNNRVAILFGREDRGLSNEDLRVCHSLINIPTASFSSLNLSQAVMIICNSIFTAAENETGQRVEFPRIAGRMELSLMYEEMESMLSEISYINPEKPDYWMSHIRTFLGRIHLQAKEVGIMRGVIRHVMRYGAKKYSAGFEKGAGRS